MFQNFIGFGFSFFLVQGFFVALRFSHNFYFPTISAACVFCVLKTADSIHVDDLIVSIFTNYRCVRGDVGILGFWFFKVLVI